MGHGRLSLLPVPYAGIDRIRFKGSLLLKQKTLRLSLPPPRVASSILQPANESQTASLYDRMPFRIAILNHVIFRKKKDGLYNHPFFLEFKLELLFFLGLRSRLCSGLFCCAAGSAFGFACHNKPPS